MTDVKINLKNIKTIYDIIALYELNSLSNQNKTISYEIIKNSVIKDLEDEDVTISYKSEMNLMEMLKKEFKIINTKLLDDISNCPEYKDIYKYYLISLNDNVTLKLEKEKFNLVTMFPSLDLIKDIMLSNVSFNVKLNILSDILKIYDFRIFEKFIRKLPQDLISKIFETNENKSYIIFNLLSFLIDNNKYEEVVSLADYFDANNEIYCFDLDNKKVSLVGLLAQKGVNIKLIKELYDNESYMNLSFNIRNNNDTIILSNLDYNHIKNFISSPNFVLTDEKINILAKKASDFYMLEGKDFESDIWYNLLLDKDIEYANLFKEKLEKLKNQVDTQKEKEKTKQENLRKLLTTTLIKVKEKVDDQFENESPKFKKILQRELTIKDLELNKKNN